jgi:hypothetical protein
MQQRMALALAGICILATGCSSHSTQATPTTITSHGRPPCGSSATMNRAKRARAVSDRSQS